MEIMLNFFFANSSWLIPVAILAVLLDVSLVELVLDHHLASLGCEDGGFSFVARAVGLGEQLANLVDDLLLVS